VSQDTETLAEDLYCALNAQPRPSWNRLRQRERQRYLDVAFEIVVSNEPLKISLHRRLRRLIADQRQGQLRFMRTGVR